MCKLLHITPKKGPFLAIWSDPDDSNVFCYLESERDTLETAGRSRRDLYSHLEPIIFTAHSTPMWCPNCGLCCRLIRLMNSRSLG